MGFASGSYAADKIFQRVKKLVGEKYHKKLAEIIVAEFEELDSDDWDMETPGSVYCVARPEECDDHFGRG